MEATPEHWEILEALEVEAKAEADKAAAKDLNSKLITHEMAYGTTYRLQTPVVCL